MQLRPHLVESFPLSDLTSAIAAGQLGELSLVDPVGMKLGGKGFFVSSES